MKPAPFEYHRPSSTDDVLSLLAEHDDAELMAGNQSLGIVMANRLATPSHIIDLNSVDELAGIDERDGSVEIGAMTRHRTIERSERLDALLPMLPEAAAQIAGPSVRNRGTIGGSMGEADPAGNYPTALVALDGTLHVRSAEGRREVTAREYFIAYMFTDLAEDELIERISISTDPFPPERTGMAFSETKPTAQTFPTLSAAAAVRLDDSNAERPTVQEARLALGNAADVPLHVDAAETAVEGTTLTDAALDAAADAAIDAAQPADEMHADAAYKRELAGEFTRRSLETAYERAKLSE